MEKRSIGTVAVDIGGTKTVLQWQSPGQEPVISSYPSREHDDFPDVLRHFIVAHRIQHIDRLSMAVAGPVIGQTARLTNLPWVIDAGELKKQFPVDYVTVINDLESLGWAIGGLSPDEMVTLETGTPAEHGTIAIVAPGTGLGEAFLTWDGSRYRAFPSEGAHADFAPSTTEQEDLLAFLRTDDPYVCVEQVASGLGIPNIYRFCRDVLRVPEEPRLEQEIAEAADATPPIVSHGLEATSERCVRVLRIFVEALAAETANLALKVMSTGGIYLGGGLSPRLLSLLSAPEFRSAFLRKGVYRHVLERMPITVILDPLAVLHGAARYACEVGPVS